MKIVTIVGARPQFVKAWPVSAALRAAGHQEFIVHTGQHYDYAMSKVFFEELNIPTPNINLEVGSGRQGRQTGLMMEGIEEVLVEQKPDWVLVYGDTNSTLAGAVAGVKLHRKIAHVEAGLRSFNRLMPEEHNRVLTDHCSDLLFCPTKTAVENLSREGIVQGVRLVGDVMEDALLKGSEIAQLKSQVLDGLGLAPKAFLLATVHRAENTDDPQRLQQIMKALEELAHEQPVIFPVHPRTRKALERIGFEPANAGPTPAIRFVPPVGYLDMIRLEESARVILTDSGGMQKEACWLQTPCVTLRQETEWIETVAAGWNQLAGTQTGDIVAAVARARSGAPLQDGGRGDTAADIVALMAAAV
jgi:UDP-N-acetylglucosamine 2-epimerase